MNSGTAEIVLFGVRVVVDSMRKSVSMNNLSQYELPPSHDASPAANLNNSVPDVAAGYASADDVVVHQSSVAGRERKRGVPWTEDEHKLFLLGLQKVGKGDWRGISRNFVKTRTPTQVASHAQKYFLRRSNLNRRRRRSSLFDITTDSVTPMPVVEEEPENRILGKAAPTTHPLPLESCNNLDLNSTAEPSSVSLQLSLASDQSQMSGHSFFQLMSFSHGDSMIRVA